MVDVTEKGHDRRARLEKSRVVGDFFQLFDGFSGHCRLGGALCFGIEAEFDCDDRRCVIVDRLVHVGHHAVGHEPLDDFDGGDGEDVAEFLHGEGRGNPHCRR